jgi:pre-mRNA cleavage complex 2 protein Pcf11
MQEILDELQNEVADELEKVSLERLADINPDLLANIKETAEDSMRASSGSTSKQDDSSSPSLPSFFTETRSREALDRSKAWSELKWNHREEAHEVVTKLQHRVRDSASSDVRYIQQEAIEMAHFLATASVTASLITIALERIQNQEDRKENKANVSFPGVEGAVGNGGAILNRGFSTDKSLFTNDGIKNKNEAVIGILYEIGLPFVSSADGRRFATQLELSNHLDALFKRNQLEKSMARTEERGWYMADILWTGETKEGDLIKAKAASEAKRAADDMFDPEKSTKLADETRDRCVICGITFKMFFDNDDGVYKYSNCREIEVLNDDEVALNESDQMLVHVTCWRGLGSPEVLTTDQARQEALGRQ